MGKAPTDLAESYLSFLTGVLWVESPESGWSDVPTNYISTHGYE